MKNTLTVLGKRGSKALLAALILLTSAPFITPAPAHAAEVINTWWPAQGVRVAGTQPFKAMVPGLDVSRYEMFWQVDGGQWNWMDSNYADYPHKEASVNVGGWNWRGNGPYVVNFIARKNGVIIAQYPVTIYVDNGSPATAQVASQRANDFTPSANIPPTTTQTAPVTPVSQPILASAPVESVISASPTLTSSLSTVSVAMNPLAGFKFYVNSDSAAARQAREWQYSNPVGAGQMRYLAAQPTAVWLGEWNANVTEEVRSLVGKAQAAGSVPTFVAYAIPQRDCGGYSSGGTNNPSAYRNWIGAVASGIGSGKAVVILEPDSLAQITCLSSGDQAARLALLSEAVSTLKKNPGTKVYIDAGHSGWIDAATMADRLSRAGIAAADGFALNVSNFRRTSEEIGYGTAVSEKTGGKHFVVDTSRNGNGSNGEWCNPSGRAVGSQPTTSTGNSRADAYLWLKVPGESDGACNGGPSAGTWWASYALNLVQSAGIAGL